MKLKFAILLLTVVFAAIRTAIIPRLVSVPSFEGTYEALAHVFVGFLIIVPFYDRKNILGPAKLYGWMGWLLTIWETAWFVLQKAHSR